MEKMSPVATIRRFFEKDGGRKIELKELQALKIEEREELAHLCAKEMGTEVIITNVKT